VHTVVFGDQNCSVFLFSLANDWTVLSEVCITIFINFSYMITDTLSNWRGCFQKCKRQCTTVI